MVYVIAIVLGSSTHAWFASNNSVKAEKINVTATANVKFLEIQHAKGTIKKPLFLSPWFLFFIVPLASPQLHDYTRSRGNSNSADVLKKSGGDWG